MDCLRYDNLAFRLDGTDPETGILRGRAVLAKEGVYRYGDASGNTWAEYVPMSTLTDSMWLDSLRLSPVTLNHPKMMVDADNARSLAVGAIGDTILKLGDRLASPVTVWARDAVRAATTTHGEISLGYMATIEDKAGEWNGLKYDRVQTSRRANHVALVDRGRHGPEVRLTVDAAEPIDDDDAPDTVTDAEETFTPPADVAAAAKRGLELREEQPPSNRGGTEVGLARARQLANREAVSYSVIKRMASFFARHEVDKQGEGWGKDSKGYQAWLLWGGDAGWAWAKSVIRKVESRGDAAAWQLRADEAQEDAMTEEDKARLDAAEAAVTTEKERADAAEAKIAELQARADKAEAERDAAKTEVAQVRADALVHAMARVALQTAVQSVLGSNYNCEGKTDRELRVAALEKLGVKVDEARSDDYVIARLDAAIEAAAAKGTAAAVVAAAMNSAPAPAVPALDANHLARSQWAGN